jgi:hypothetical protein
MNSRKSISIILNISPYRAGAMRHLAAPMDRMLPQDVVGLHRIRCGECQNVAYTDREAYTQRLPLLRSGRDPAPPFDLRS